MTAINELKRGIYAAFLSSPLPDKDDELVLSCIMYDFLGRIVSQQGGLENDVRKLAIDYLPGFNKRLAELRSSFISYSLMRSKVQSYRKGTFLEFTGQEISAVIELYKNNSRVREFSSAFFSQRMYRVSGVSGSAYRRLARVHSSVMSPIAKFYSRSYGKKDSDLEISDSLGYPAVPGKEILFSVRGVPASRVVSDVRSGRIPISSPRDFYEIRVDGDKVRVTNN
jgi:hypothetical protein